MSKAGNEWSMHHSENKDGPPKGWRIFFLTHSLTLWLGQACLYPTRKKWLTTSQLSEKRYDKTIIPFPLSLLRLPNIFLYPATSKKYEDREGKEHMRIRSHTLYLGGVTHLVLSSRKKRLEELLLVLLLLKV